MVTAIINKFIGKLKKDPPETAPAPAQEKIQTKKPKENGIDTSKIDLIAFVDFVVRSFVDHPDEVTIETERNDNSLIMRVSCNKDEIRKVIGKNGKTINAIRALVKGAAKRINQNVTILVID